MTLYGLISAGTGEFSAILNTMLKLLNLKLDNYIYISQVFMYIPAVGAIPTAWFIDKYGLKIVLYIASIFMLIRSVFRALMFYPDFPHWDQYKLTYWIISGLAASQSATMFFCTPLKISENWFPSSERSIAWTVMISSYSIGATLGAFFYPRMINDVSDVKPLSYLNLGSGVVLTFVMLICITRSKPKHPPSARSIKSSAEAQKLSWGASIKRMLKHRDIILHILHETIYDSMILSVLAVIQDILIATGHSKIFVGNLIAINSLVSVVMLVALAGLVHRISDITLACKVASVARTLIFIVHLMTMLYPMHEWIIMSVSVVYTICRSWALPNMNNMTAHIISGTVSEATISGVSTTLYVIMMSIGQVAFVQLIREDANGKRDYTYSITMACIVAVVNSLVYMIFFKGQQAKTTDQLAAAAAIEPSRENGNVVAAAAPNGHQNLTESHDNRAYQNEA